MRLAAAVLLLAAGVAHAGGDDESYDWSQSEGCLKYSVGGYRPERYCGDHRLRAQWQIELGVGVLGAGLEAPVARHVGVEIEAVGVSTFYLKAAGGGTNTYGYGAGVRATWIAGERGDGLYVAPAVRFAYVRGERDDMPGHGLAAIASLTFGEAFRVRPKVDLRVGLGAMLVHYDVKTGAGPLETTTPFVAFELVLGFRSR